MAHYSIRSLYRNPRYKDVPGALILCLARENSREDVARELRALLRETRAQRCMEIIKPQRLAAAAYLYLSPRLLRGARGEDKHSLTLAQVIYTVTCAMRVFICTLARRTLYNARAGSAINTSAHISSLSETERFVLAHLLYLCVQCSRGVYIAYKCVTPFRKSRFPFTHGKVGITRFSRSQHTDLDFSI